MMVSLGLVSIETLEWSSLVDFVTSFSSESSVDIDLAVIVTEYTTKPAP